MINLAHQAVATAPISTYRKIISLDQEPFSRGLPCMELEASSMMAHIFSNDHQLGKQRPSQTGSMARSLGERGASPAGHFTN